ncbi:MAG: type I 3-dehydroquinate dehydratase [Planctomycetes bacterium]|nr:type I 3-dehydroquinate dehydratase [Planctomycetota bacterium]
MICVSLGSRNSAQALAGMEEARRAGADLVEIRGDFLDDPGELPEIAARKSLPVVVTVRPAWEGGRWAGTEEGRVRLLESACAAGADWVDVEFEAYKDFARGGTRLLLSYHDFSGVPADLERIAAKMRAMEPDLVKIAVTARGAADLARCVRLQKSMGVPSAVVAMGEAGEALRILYRRFGGSLTYASLCAGAETAPGQVPVSDLGGVDGSTEAYAVVGRPVAHSRSPALFNAAFRALGMNARYVKIPLEDAALLPELVSALELRGVSVTIPHKEKAAELLGFGEPGAVNTVVVRDGVLEGHNTDAPAAAEAVGPVAGKRVLVLGSGGAARAVAWGLAGAGARMAVSSRRGESLGREAVAWERRGDAGAEVVVNATSVGMNSDESPFPPEAWRPGMRAFDVVYTPRDTRFLREARAAGAETVDGVELFVRQAAMQFRLFTGREMPREVVEGFRRGL